MARKQAWIPLLSGSLFVLLLTATLQFPHHRLSLILGYLQNVSYDVMLRKFYVPLSKNSPVVILDIDDESIEREGRWPWSRARMESVVTELYRLGAKGIALDIVFSESEPNLAAVVVERLKTIPSGASAIPELESVESQFDDDSRFGEALGKGDAILGFAMQKRGSEIGKLPTPLLQLSPELQKELLIPIRQSYIANIAVLQQNAKGEGFVNARSDLDGVVRFSPMLYRRGDFLYPSLSLAALKLFLPEAPIDLIVVDYGKQKVLEGIQFGSRAIPLNPWGEILVPFRGPPYSLPYFSATRLLRGAIPKEHIDGKLVFVGSSATFMGDLVSSAIAPVFPGIEIHAQIAASILDGYMPYKPGWINGAIVAELLLVGLSFALILSIVNPGIGLILTALAIAALFGVDHYLWIHQQIVYSSTLTMITLVILLIFNGIYHFFVERKKELFFKSMFGYYIPKERVDQMAEKGKVESLEGETKNLTVLFADIRNFTSISEPMSASEIKTLLNRFLSEMTSVIFHHKGTIDKYIGDLIMAFWGAPIDDPNHELNGVLTALEMQKKLKQLTWDPKYPPIQIGIGINSGSMSVGDMGSNFRRAYTVIGDSVNIGSRLESSTKYYKTEILAGEETYKKTKEAIFYRPIDRVQFKGTHRGILIFEPLCKAEEADSELKKRVELHFEALNAYFKQSWDQAADLFTHLKELAPADPLPDLFLSRIAHFREHPPANDWDGTYELSAK